jgi:Fe-S-cluster containining protein
MHHQRMQCKAGCSSCCQAFKVLPIEFDYISEKLAEVGIVNKRKVEKGQCKFLIDNNCSIYEHRPIICRSHGFPLVRLNEEVEEYEVSYCHLNFKAFPLESFNAENVYFEDKFNSILNQANRQYIKEMSLEETYDPGQLVELNNVGK